MKTTVLLFAAFAAFTAQAQVNYNIQGTTDKYSNGRYVYLVRPANPYSRQTEVILDSAKVVGNAFAMKSRLPSEQVLAVKQNYSEVAIVAEPGVIRVDLDREVNLASTVQNKVIADYEEGRNRIQRNYGLLFGKVENDSTLSKEAYTVARKWVSEAYGAAFDSLATKYLTEFKDKVVAEYVLNRSTVNIADNDEKFFRFYSLIMGNRQVSYGPLQANIQQYTAVRNTSAGHQFVDFTVPLGNEDGSSVKLSDYVGKGKYVLLDFWASWCIWCRAESSHLAELYKKYQGPHFEIVSMAVNDKKEATLEAIKKDKVMIWKHIFNGGNEQMHLYGVYGIPMIILFASDGTIVERNLRGDHLKQVVDHVMAQYPTR